MMADYNTSTMATPYVTTVYNNSLTNETIVVTATGGSHSQWIAIHWYICVYLGFCTMAMNGITFSYIARLLKKQSNLFCLQMLFLSGNDIASGMLLSLRAIIQVHSNTDAIMCAIVMVINASFNIISKGHLLCICIQRYMLARNINNPAYVWQQVHVYRMVGVNVFAGVLAGLALIPGFDLNKGVYKTHICDGNAMVKRSHINSFSIFTTIAFVVIILSDILCPLTIQKLRQASKKVVPAAVASVSITDITTGSGSVSTEVRSNKKQRQAIVTIVILLASLNISFLPISTSLLVKMAGGLVTPTIMRVGIIATYIPMFVNPILVATRMQSLRAIIRKDIVKIKSWFDRD